MRVLAALINRAFWIGICLVILATMFVSAFTFIKGWPLLVLSLIGVMIGFSILRLASAPLKPRHKKGRPPGRSAL